MGDMRVRLPDDRPRRTARLHNFSTLAVGEATILRLRPLIPKDAQVAFFIVTDKQYGMTREFFGTRPTKKKPNMPEQVELF